MTFSQWLRRSFIAGFFVTVPLVISVVALVWIFQRGRRRDGAALDAPARPAGARPGPADDDAVRLAGRGRRHRT